MVSLLEYKSLHFVDEDGARAYLVDLQEDGEHSAYIQHLYELQELGEKPIKLWLVCWPVKVAALTTEP